MMNFSDFIEVGAIRADLKALDKETVIEELVEALVQSGGIQPQDKMSIVEAVMKREELGSTGIGRGVAVPHTKHANVNRLIGTVGISRVGVEFSSLDGEKVFIFFLLVSPPDRPTNHLRALESISRQLRDDTFCRFLKQAQTPEDIRQLLEEADNDRKSDKKS